MVHGRLGAGACVLAGLLAMACGGDDAGTPIDASAADATAPDAPSSNATLAGLSATAGVLAPPFEPEITEYDLDLVLAEDATAFRPVAAMPAGTTIAIDGTTVGSGTTSGSFALTPGSRDIDLVVSAADGSVTTYRVHVHRGVDALATLTPSTGTVAPGFDAATTDYTVGLPVATAAIAWTPTLMIPGRASVTVMGASVTSGAASAPIGLGAGDNPIAVVVTPQTRPARSYTAAVFRGTNGLASVALSYAGGAIANQVSPGFDPLTAGYAVDVGLWLQQVQVSAVPLYPGATITVAGGAVAAGQPSAPVPLNLGATPIAIVVTAPGGAQHTYTLDVTRANQVVQQVYAKASNTGVTDGFGIAIAIAGDTLAVAAHGEASSALGVGGNQADNSAAFSGAVYVFTRTGTTWSQQAYVKASNTGAGDWFGVSVALSGDTLAVGAYHEASNTTGIDGNQADNSAASSGAVYVFTRSGTTWSQQAYVKASNSATNDRFGTRVALSGDTLAVGASLEDSAAIGIGGDQTSNVAADSGAVYVFSRSGTTWSQQAYLKASNTGSNDVFGHALGLSGNTLAVGAYAEDSVATGLDGDQSSNAAPDSGAVYVFTRTGTTWSQQAYLKASNTGANDQFGIALALWNDTLAVGADFEDSAAIGIGGNQADNTASISGAVYVFTRSGTTWSQQAYVKASNTGAGDEFGNSLALWGDTLAVSARREASNGNPSDNSSPESGAVYVFIRSGSSWVQSAFAKASNSAAFDFFGQGLAVWGDTVAAGAYREDSAATGLGGNQADDTGTDSGAVYVFR